MPMTTVASWRCQCDNVHAARVRACPECGTVRPAAAPAALNPTRCHWRGAHGARCLLRGTAIYGVGDGETRFCSWHDDVRTPDRAKLAEDFGEFEAWCLRLRARGYCGARFEFSHADPRWLYGLVTGDDTTPLDPPSRVGCAKTSCPFGWNGQRVRDAVPPVAPAGSESPRGRDERVRLDDPEDRPLKAEAARVFAADR